MAESARPPDTLLLLEPEEVDWAEGHRLFHHLWGKAHDGPGYVKDEWYQLQRLLEAAERRSR